MLSLSGGYLAYGKIATQNLDKLVYTEPGSGLAAPPASDTPGAGSTPASGEFTLSTSSAPAPSALGLYPGPLLPFNTWAEPWNVAPLADDSADLVRQFLPVRLEALSPLGTMPQPTRILIPSIEVDATVEGLAIRELGDSREYQTPNRVVGHIPTTANPGEKSTGWYFGHLESPLRGEGSVFRDLPRIPELLRKGQRVLVQLESSQGSYLYEVYDSTILPQDDLRVVDKGASDIVLVTCVPEWKYNYRLLVTARLIGMKPPA